MNVLKLSEAKAHLGKYVQEVSQGESFIISERNRPIAKLVSIVDDRLGVRPKTGLMKGLCDIPEDFDEPLPEFEQDFYGS